MQHEIVCLHCDGTDFVEKLVFFEPEICDETVEVCSYAHVCLDCGEPLMDADQMNRLRRNTADAYRIRHKLLTSREIIFIRKNKTLSGTRKELAAVLDVSEGDIRKWETFYVQPKEIDERLREL